MLRFQKIFQPEVLKKIIFLLFNFVPLKIISMNHLACLAFRSLLKIKKFVSKYRKLTKIFLF